MCAASNLFQTQEVADKLNTDLINIGNWIQNHGLAINAKKTEFMHGSHLGSPQKLKSCQQIDLYLDGVYINEVESYKYLEVIVDENITWFAHTDYISRNVSARIGLLRRIRPLLTIPTAKLIWNTTISPLLDYCDVVWDSCTVTAATKLQRLQNLDGRLILRADNNMPSEDASAKGST